MSYRIGIDVGGTNTDAVLLDGDLRVMACAKTPTTAEVTTGIFTALRELLRKVSVPRTAIAYAMLGTTHCTNAIVERKRLNRVGIIRLGAPAAVAIKPLTGWPEDLAQTIGKKFFILRGGHEFDGREINPPDLAGIQEAAREMRGEINSVAVTAVFSPVCNEHELAAARILQEELGGTPISLSHEIGTLGLLERENATILNASIVSVLRAVVDGFRRALAEEGIAPRILLSQNDGTLMSVEYAERYPILTIASGPTNSIRGAAFLAGCRDALVVDVGGTTTDIGVLANGFPRESSIAVEIGGVRTNFRMPDLYSMGLGGGTVIRRQGGATLLGPDSVGYLISREALVFGGATTTFTDVAVGLGRAHIGDPDKVATLPGELMSQAYQRAVAMVEDGIDRMKTGPEPAPVIAVGGGSVLLPDQLAGAAQVQRPEHFEVANAIGVAIAQVSGQVDRIFALDEAGGREGALEKARQIAVEEAVKAGAQPGSVEIVELEDVPIAYLPGNASRIRARAAGRLAV